MVGADKTHEMVAIATATSNDFGSKSKTCKTRIYFVINHFPDLPTTYVDP